MIEVINADITTLQIDAIVNATVLAFSQSLKKYQEIND